MTNAAYRVVANQARATLNTGHSIPLVGLGTWKASKGEVKEAVITAVRAGYRHIDCAAIYGNEHEIGEALTQLFSEGVVKREDLFITSKLWNTEHAPDRVEPALRKTLGDLQLDAVDLYLIHWPNSVVPGPEVNPPLLDTWRAMEAVFDKGLAKSVGVSNFSIKKLEALVAQARIKPAANQVEAHPYWRNDALLKWTAAHGIHLQAYSPLGSPDSAAMFQRPEDTPSLLQDKVVNDIAAKHGKNAGQVLIRWAIQRGTSVLPKSVNPGRIAGNLDVFDWSLDKEDEERLNNLPQIRLVKGAFLVHPDGPYKSISDLWDEPDLPASL